jgi:hypothetical protein
VEQALPDSYLQLKRGIIGDELNQAALKRSWASLTDRLAFLSDDVEKRQQAVGTEQTRAGLCLSLLAVYPGSRV